MGRFFLLILAFATPFIFPRAFASEDKFFSDQQAKAAFLQLDFFAEGRGMHVSPGLITYFNRVMAKLPSPDNRRLDLRRWFTRRWGMNFQGKEIVGLFDKDHEGLRVGAVGCVACHSGRAAGQFVVGLGNKNIDVVRMAKDLYRMERWWKHLVPARKKTEAYLDLEEDALAFSHFLSNERLGNLTQGLVPVSFVFSWFWSIHGEPVPERFRRGQVKVPMLWGYEEKRKIGLFSDGFGDPEQVGWGALVELAAGQRPEAVRRYYPKIVEAEKLFNFFLPPKYPFEINRQLAERGKAVFSKTCAGCHGSYERNVDGYPIFQAPKWIPWSVVRTDGDRTFAANDDLKRKIGESPLRDLIRHLDLGHGYFAPRLEGIWSRFPYLHNGSVPSIEALLTGPKNRPEVFSLKDVGELYRFDKISLGIKVPERRAGMKALKARARKGNRSIYDVSRAGHSNQGHDFFTDLGSGEKKAIVEYLKTL